MGEHAMEMAEDVRTAQQRSATLQEELDRAKADLDQFKSTATQRTAELKEARGKLAQQEAQMAEHRKGFIQSTNAMHNQLCATKKANDALQGRIAQLTTELDTLRGKLSAAERANATLKTSNEALNARLTQSSEEQKRLADDLATALREQSAQVEAQVATALALLGMQNQGGAAAEVGTGTGSEAAPTAAFCSVLGLPVVTSNGNQDGEKSDAPVPKRRRTCTCGRNDKVERGEPTKTGHRDGARRRNSACRPSRQGPLPLRVRRLCRSSQNSWRRFGVYLRISITSARARSAQRRPTMTTLRSQTFVHTCAIPIRIMQCGSFVTTLSQPLIPQSCLTRSLTQVAGSRPIGTSIAASHCIAYPNRCPPLCAMR